VSAPYRTVEPHHRGTSAHARLRALSDRDRTADPTALLPDDGATAAPDRPEGPDRERRLREVARQVADRIPELADAVASLVELAEQEDEPRLQRFAALCRSRTESVLSLARGLEEAAGAVPVEPRRKPHLTDLRAAVTRAVRNAGATAGAGEVRLEAGNEPLPVRCDAATLERSVTHLVVTALLHSRGGTPVLLRLTEAAARGAHGVPTDGATRAGTLTVVAEDSPVTTAELARIVARFLDALGGEPSGQPQEPARIRISGDGVSVESGSLHGQAFRDGRLVVHAEWPLEGGPVAVMPAHRSL
jgi:signal transduction histidine kinase